MKAVYLGEEVYAEWDDDGDLHLYTSEDGAIDDVGSAEIWMNVETVAGLKAFLSAGETP